MSIKVVYDSLFFDVTRCHEETVATGLATVEALIELLSQRHGSAFRETIVDAVTHAPRPEVTILVNGRRQPWNMPIADGAEVAFLVPIAGGAP